MTKYRVPVTMIVVARNPADAVNTVMQLGGRSNWSPPISIELESVSIRLVKEAS